MATIMGIEMVARDKPLTVYTDSKYVVDFVNKWRHMGTWRTKEGTWVQNSVNLKLQIRLSDLIDSRKPARTSLIHVYGHKKNAGNLAADGLATKGAAMEDV